jgi:predicted unusual protein kinase regulating ubiquinone biosynthesis (AarF/ABC1/UbiB family)/ribosomal protein L7/L12
MRTDEVRSAVATRLSASSAPLPKSTLGRSARLVAALSFAGARSLGRSVGRRVGLKRPSIEPERMVAASFGQLKGVAMKWGQILGYFDTGLPDNLRAALAALHTQAQPLSVERIRAVLRADLGAAGEALADGLHAEPLSTASIGQVHRAALPDGTAVAVKVIHPGLAEIIAREFAPALMASRVATFFYRRAHLDAFVRQARARLLEECDYVLEARRQQRFAQLFAGHPTVLVPEVHRAYCSPRVLTSTYVEGESLDGFLAAQPDEQVRRRAGEALFDFYVGTLFKHGLYNCDPHPGNYLFLKDGRVAFVDFGCVREFEPGFVGALASLTDALIADDRERIYRALVALGIADGATPYHHEATRWLLRAFYGPLLRDEESAFDVGAELKLRQLVRTGWRARGLAVSGELLFLLRTFLGMTSILGRIGARTNWRRHLQQILAERTVEPVAAQALEAEAAAAAPSAASASEPASEAAPELEPAPAAVHATVVTEAPAAPAESVTPAAAATPAPDGPDQIDAIPVTVDESVWDIVLLDAGASVISVVREIRELTGMDLREVKYIIDATPQTIKQALPRAEAETLRLRLESAGARVEMRRASPTDASPSN